MALEPLLHVTTAAAWAEAAKQGVYRAPSLDTQGFIHLSLPRQWLATVARFYRGQAGLVLLVVRPAALTAEVRFEPADGDEFPHLYGELPVMAVAGVLPILLDGNGRALSPDGLSTALAEATG